MRARFDEFSSPSWCLIAAHKSFTEHRQTNSDDVNETLKQRLINFQVNRIF